ncbi:MAG: PTS fructose transporter subunit IIA [Rhodobacterales bacterium]|nr:MAG: PTS fructose transporter subunit IIA [Rhodobacterales bacterium]
MIGIVIVAHGGLAAEYLAAVEHVLGRQDGMRAIKIGAECDRDAKTAEIKDAADSVDRGEGVVVVVDMFGGSPSNLSIPACLAQDRHILFGANLPMLVKLVQSRHRPIHDAVARAEDAGRKYLSSYNPAPR